MATSSKKPTLKPYKATGDIVFGDQEAGEVSPNETIRAGTFVELNPEHPVVKALLGQGKLKEPEGSKDSSKDSSSSPSGSSS